MIVELRRPELQDKVTILEMMSEFENEGAAHDGGFWSSEGFHYDDWLEANKLNEMGVNIPKDFVPSIQFVSFDTMGKAVGFLHLRLRLTDSLRKKGGHVGYSIRPSQRGKGFAKKQLALGIELAHQKNIKQILVTCSHDNEASRRTILANGGRLLDCQNGIERYCIE